MALSPNEWDQSTSSLAELDAWLPDLDLCYHNESMTGSSTAAPMTPASSLESTQSNLSLRSNKARDSAYSQQEWENVKCLIKSLYAKMTLDQMIVHMREQHGFDAQRHKYLRRITRWGFNKNSKAEEKQIVADLIASNAGELPFEVKIPIHKVRRHIKSQRKLPNKKPCGVRCLGDMSDTSTETDSSVLTPLICAYNSSTVFTGDYLFIPSWQVYEEFLMAMREYTSVSLEVYQDPAQSAPRVSDVSSRARKSSVYHFWTHLRAASFALDSHGHAGTLAFHHLERVCVLVESALRQSHWRFMIRLITELCKLMKLDPTVANELLGFTREMARTVFGSNPKHCVVRALEIFESIHDEPDAFERAGKVVLSVVEQQAPESSNLHHQACRDVQFLYAAFDLHESAQELAASAARHCLDRDEGTSLKSRETRLRLSRCYLEVGNYEATREMTQSLLQLYHDTRLPPDWISVSASEDLGLSCLHLGMVDEALKHLDYALETLDYSKWRWNTYQIRRNYCTQLGRNIKRWKLRDSTVQASEAELAELMQDSICGVADKDFQKFEIQYTMNST